MLAAATAADLERLQSLLVEDATAVNEKDTKDGNTALHVACGQQNVEICQLLLEHAADPSMINENGYTALHSLVESKESILPIEKRSSLLQLLLEHKSPISAKTKDGKTPIHIAAARGYTRTLILLANHSQKDLNSTDNNGLTPIILAARNNRNETVHALLGQELELKTFITLETEAANGKLPSDIVKIVKKHYWSKTFQSQIAQYPGKQGTLFQLVIENNKTDIGKILKKEKGLQKKRGPFNSSLLHFAAIFSTDDTIQYLLDKHKLPINLEMDGQLTPLHMACIEGRLKTCEFLLRNKADPCVEDEKGFTPLHFLASIDVNDPIGFHKILKMFLQYGARVDAPNKNGYTPLHLAAQNGIEQSIVYLKPLGANINALTIKGDSPIQIAARNNQLDIVGILIGLGSDLTGLQHEYQHKTIPKEIMKRFEEKLSERNSAVQSNYMEVGKQATKKGRRASVSVGGEEHQVILIDHINNIICTASELSRHLRNEYKPFINRTGSSGQAPIHIAAMEGNAEAMRLLLSRFQCDVNIVDTIGFTPLLYACKYGRLDVIEVLLEEESLQVHSVTEKSLKSPLHFLSSFPIQDVTRVSLVVKGLIDKGLYVHPRTNRKGFLPAHYAARRGNSNTIAILHFFGCDLTSSCYNGLTPLHMAAVEGLKDNVNTFLQLGASIHGLEGGIQENIYDDDIIDCYHHPPEVLERSSLTFGKSLRLALSSDMFTPQDHPIHDYIISNPSIQDVSTFLSTYKEECLQIPNLCSGRISSHLACAQGNYEVLKFIMNDHFISADRLDGKGCSCLHIAALQGDTKICNFLLTHKANPFLPHSKGTLIHLLSSIPDGKAHQISELIGNLCIAGIGINALNDDGLSALHIASISGNSVLLNALLENNADIDIQSLEGESPLEVGMKHQKKSSVRLLRSKGASVDWLTPENEKKFTGAMLEVIKILSDQRPSNTPENLPESLPTSSIDEEKHFLSYTSMGNKAELRKMIRKNPKLLHTKNHEGSSVLHIAALLQNQELMALFIEKKLDPNIVNAKGYAPLLMAAEAGNLPVCEFLMLDNHGTDTRVSSQYGWTALHFLAATCVDVKEEKLLQRVIKLLIDNGANVCQRTCNGDTPLHIASQCGNPTAVASLLLYPRILLNVENHFGESPLRIAIEKDQTMIIRLLLESRADPSFLVDPSFQRSLPKLSTSSLDTLRAHRIELVQDTNRKRAESLLHRCYYPVKVQLSIMNETILPTLPKETIEVPYNLVAMPKSQDTKNHWKTIFLMFCRPTELLSSSSKHARMDSIGFRSFLREFNIELFSLDVIGAFAALNGPDNPSISFHQFYKYFGSAMLLLAGGIDVPAQKHRNTARMASTPSFSTPTTSRMVLPASMKPLPPGKSPEIEVEMKTRSKPKVPPPRRVYSQRLPPPNSIVTLLPSTRCEKPRASSVAQRTFIPKQEEPVMSPSKVIPTIIDNKEFEAAYHYFGSMYDHILATEKISLMTIDIFESYFKDSFTSYNLLRTIVPTLMAQKDLEQGITREAFCSFFLAQKTKSLSHCLGVLCQLKKELSLTLSDTLTGYNNYSSVDRFKSRMYLQQFSTLFGGMEENLVHTRDSFLQCSAHQHVVLNEYDETIISLQKRMLGIHEALNKWYVPRKIEKIEGAVEGACGATGKGNILLIRTVTTDAASDHTSALRSIIDSYVVRSLMVTECLHGSVSFQEPITFKITQIWSSASALDSFMSSPLHTEFLASSDSFKVSDVISVSKVAS